MANFVLDNTDLQPFNGNTYAKVDLNSTDSIWVAYTTFGSYLPKGKEVYLEIDYYTTNRVVTSLLAISPSGLKKNPNIQLNKSTPETVKWKKMYIELRELIGASEASAYFDHGFEAWKESSLPNTCHEAILGVEFVGVGCPGCDARMVHFLRNQGNLA
jgi:hypothetical protein